MEEYHEVVNQLLNIPRYKKHTDQVGIARLLELLGNPQHQYKTIHIAGTNGKGSVSAYLQAIGIQKGYQMGMFTSPHLIDIRERFQINNTMISQEDFVSCAKEVFAAEQKLWEEKMSHCTFFEMILAIGLLYFQKANVDYAIIEAGMGGGSDSTNVLLPVISVITSIGLDHTAVLGETLLEIAREKAGILKPDIPAVVAKCDTSAEQEIAKYGERIGAKCHFTREYDVRILKNTTEGIDFLIKNRYDKEGCFSTTMCGLYQVDNAVTAIMAASVLWDMPYDTIAKGIENAKWPARMEKVQERFYVDGAHNHQAMISFVRTVAAYFHSQKKVLLYAVASDKDNAQMIEELAKLSFQEIIITELENTRKTSSAIVAQQFQRSYKAKQEIVPKLTICENMTAAIESALVSQKEDNYLFCVGSLYLAGAVKKYLSEN